MQQIVIDKLDPATLTLPAEIGRLRTRAWLVGGVATLAVVAGALLDPTQFFRSYLVGWLLWAGVAVGSLALMMLHHVTGGSWGLPIRRILEASTRTLPLVALLMVPLFFGMRHIFPWAEPGVMEHDAVLAHKAAYLNVTGFIIRAAIYFAIWILLALLLNRWSLAQDARRGGAGAEQLQRRMRILSAPGILLFVLTATFAGFDWLMSLEPHWFSSIYGVYFIGSMVLAALAFTIITAHTLKQQQPMSDHLTAHHFNDYGNLMLAFVTLWAYFSVSQLLIIWSANLPEEIGWYLSRLEGSWGRMGLVLALAHFALPFLLLLSRQVKRHHRLLAGLAAAILFMRWVDFLWQSAPAYSPEHFTIHWLDLVTPIAVGGIWVAVFVMQLGRRPLLPVGAPDLQEADSHG